jgi:hypothetical protein
LSGPEKGWRCNHRRTDAAQGESRERWYGMSRAVIVAPDFNPDIVGVAQVDVWYLIGIPFGPGT